MPLPDDSKAAEAAKMRAADASRILHVMQRKELRLVTLFKEHWGTFASGLVLCLTGLAAYWLTSR